jgi:hypothetical protein
MTYLRHVLYDLRKTFPKKIVLTQKGVSTGNLRTGTITTPSRNYTIRDAIVLPQTMGLLKQSGLGLYSDITKSERIIIIDYYSLPRTYTFNKDDVIVFDDKKWTISKSYIHEKIAYELLVKEVVGSERGTN